MKDYQTSKSLEDTEGSFEKITSGTKPIFIMSDLQNQRMMDNSSTDQHILDNLNEIDDF